MNPVNGPDALEAVIVMEDVSVLLSDHGPGAPAHQMKCGNIQYMV